MTTRPKYTAARPFSCAGHTFSTGDAVTVPYVLDAVLAHGDHFVVTASTRRKAGSADTTQVEAQPTTTEETS